ncbi:hypothetical protein [Kitasatospora sp. CB01950]|uniref:hypothetical protein n=1 Tax=Kitasatospora sp. CB01950 TaxID=1703930 RepID=UPI00093EB5CE|nr:hypothetical protein [Kitasatospora sp. CB01950]OKJ05244.1 hypothetical protein AMK19_25955 [Kitasatospora sp. CB01950]
MSNLGRYQDIVTEAKLAGGVDKLIEIIEKTAAGKGHTRGVRNGAVGTMAVAALIAGGAVTKRAWDRRKTRQAQQAKEQLRTMAEQGREPGSPHSSGRQDH